MNALKAGRISSPVISYPINSIMLILLLLHICLPSVEIQPLCQPRVLRCHFIALTAVWAAGFKAHQMGNWRTVRLKASSSHTTLNNKKGLYCSPPYSYILIAIKAEREEVVWPVGWCLMKKSETSNDGLDTLGTSLWKGASSWEHATFPELQDLKAQTSPEGNFTLQTWKSHEMIIGWRSQCQLAPLDSHRNSDQLGDMAYAGSF